jgi:hypothetical protein
MQEYKIVTTGRGMMPKGLVIGKVYARGVVEAKKKIALQVGLNNANLWEYVRDG